MNNVHSLYPAKLESYDILGNQYTLHLQGMSPVGITTLGELPNIVIHDAATHFYFFLRIEWKNIEVARNSFAGQNLTALSRDYVKHLAEQVVEAGISLPAGARMEDVDNLIATVRDIMPSPQRGGPMPFSFLLRVVVFGHRAQDNVENISDLYPLIGNTER